MSSIPKIFLLSLLCLVLGACAQGFSSQQHGLLANTPSHASYASSTRPNIRIATALAPQGCEKKTLKLHNAGAIGGLPVETYVSVFGQKDSAMALIAHAELPPGWTWDAGMRHAFSIDNGWTTIGGIPFFAQTFLQQPGKNPLFEEDPDIVAAKKSSVLIRSFSARFSSDRVKIVLEYREKLPQPFESVQQIPYGQNDFIAAFTKRANQAFSISAYDEPKKDLECKKIPFLATRFLDEHTLGSATPTVFFDPK